MWQKLICSEISLTSEDFKRKGVKVKDTGHGGKLSARTLDTYFVKRQDD